MEQTVNWLHCGKFTEPILMSRTDRPSLLLNETSNGTDYKVDVLSSATYTDTDIEYKLYRLLTTRVAYGLPSYGEVVTGVGKYIG